MATRRETTQRRLALNETLRSACRSGAFQPGEMLPSVRELASKHSVSMKVVCDTLATLVDEGVLYTVPRVGTFVGHNSIEAHPYLFVSRFLKPITGIADHMRIGFEERIAQLGGSCLSLDRNEALHYWREGTLPPISGIFEVSRTAVGAAALADGLPYAVFDYPQDGEPLVDIVNFDNEEGGAKATHHLLGSGHKDIAFLALHSQHNVALIPWSAKRELGWQRVMQQSGAETDALLFRPEIDIDIMEGTEHCKAGYDMAASVIKRPDITAVVAVNMFTAHGFLHALHDSGINVSRWPAIVCFDWEPSPQGAGLTYIRLPWEKIGSEAAQLLWEKKNGRVDGQLQQRLVPMQLIPRMTSRLDWASTSSRMQPQFEPLSAEPLAVETASLV